ncbi:BRO family protein [Yersinia mollaretii]|uniref:BRO family protein n=1 Tax=Yersinia mollaretii TaxID=33060 RepID=UPI0011A0E2D1|nr:BRO family protein [Yersinia mollaretii]
MKSRNGEAPTTWNSQGFDLSATLSESTDMKSIANNQLTFHNTKFNPVQDNGQVWLTSSELGAALQYSDDKAVQRIYSRRCDEFTERMTRVVKLTTPRGQQDTRVFSLRGAHLIAIFSRTKIAKEFRKWVLDILDNEVSTGNHQEPLQKRYTLNVNADELNALAWLYKAANNLREKAEILSDGLKSLHSPYGSSLWTMAAEYKRSIENARKVLSREIGNIPPEELSGLSWEEVLPNIHIH